MNPFADINFSSNTWAGTSRTDVYKSTFGYDANGNITRLGFNGKEKDDEMETMDFGARLLDGDLGSWLACDPLMSKYPDLSPYNFSANNPILFIDPDGKKIFVYVDGKAYEYKPGVKPVEGSPDLLLKVHEAATYAMKTKKGAEVWNAIGASDKILNIESREATRKDVDEDGNYNTDQFRGKFFDRKEGDKVLGTLYWDVNSPVEVCGTSEGKDGTALTGLLSPSTVLLHELGHVFLMEKALKKGLNSPEWSTYLSTLKQFPGEDDNKRWGSKDEQNVIEQIEAPYIDEINDIEGKDGSYQQKRYSHKGQIKAYVNNSDVNKNPTKAEQQKEYGTGN